MEELTVGFVRGAHGTQGEVKVGSYSGELEHLLSLSEVTLRCHSGERRLKIEQVRLAHSEALVKFAGVDTRDEAARLTRCELWAPRAAASPRGEDEYYIADLIGCGLYSAEAPERPTARVVSVWNSGICDMLEVETESGQTYNVPFREP
jgi:16S rRNA processing protein RimM